MGLELPAVRLLPEPKSDAQQPEPPRNHENVILNTTFLGFFLSLLRQKLEGKLKFI